MVVGAGYVVCVPSPWGDTRCPSALEFPLWWALPMLPVGAVCQGTAQQTCSWTMQLDHDCHLSVRQLMSLHLVAKFKLFRMQSQKCTGS